ncbi:MAG: glycosyltransferase family 39 protein [bacterium]|nr:glycosyltransferase family 39 protein [bacterium]
MHKRTIQLLSIGLFLGLLLWGSWTFFIYLGVGVHGAVLLPKEALESLTVLCDANAFLCRGFYSLSPFIHHTLTRVPHFIWYTGISAAVYALMVLWGYVRHRDWNLQWKMTPWKLLLFFVAMIWLIFTCISLTQNGAVSMNTLVEPRPEVYQGAGDEALAALQKNYSHLKSRGCLTRIGVFGGVAEASKISMLCIQGSFVTRVLPPLIFLLLLTLELLIAGRYVLRKILKIPARDLFMEMVLSLGVGAGTWIVLLWIGAVAHIYTTLFGWILLLSIPAIGLKDAQYWVEKFLYTKWSFTSRWRSFFVFLSWFLLSYLAFNYLNVIRPFPIGWDDLGSYLNRPRLLVSYGKFVHSMQTFQWEYLTSLGFLLFGYESIFGATVALIINWYQGVLAILTIYLFGRTFMGPGRGVLAAALYYTLPLVGHFSFADMKIDNAVFVMSALSMFCVFESLFHIDEDRAVQRRWILLSGLFVGLAFSMKITSIMVFMAMGTMILGVSLHWIAYPAALMFAGAVFTKQDLISISRIAEKVNINTEIITPTVLITLFAIVGCIFFGIAARIKPQNVKGAVINAAILVAGFGMAIFPWIEHNNIQHGNIIPKFALKSPNTLTPLIDQSGTSADKTPYSLPPELATDSSNPHCQSTAGTEELDRYWGHNHVGWSHYLGLPWRQVMNLDHAGYYVTTAPALLLFPLLLLLPFFWKKQGRWLRWMWSSTVFLLLQWIFFANGVPWYGIGIFLGLVLCLEALVAKAPDVLSRTVAGIFISLSLLVCLGMRFWQFDSQRNLFEYPIGKISAETIRERTIPYYDDITDIVLERNQRFPDRPLLYRIGTFLPYFVPKNLEIIGVTDHQLDTFNCLYQERDNALTLKRLKALGFNSIVFDTNTATIEKDVNGSLHKKVQALTDFLNSEEAGLNVVIFDPGAGIAFLLIP